MLKLLALLKGLSFMSKFASISRLFAWLPGGQIVAILGSVAGAIVSAASALLSFVVWFMRWLIADIEDAFKEWQRAVVRFVSIMVVLAGGVYLGIQHDAQQVAVAKAETKGWKVAHQRLIDESVKTNAADKAAHLKALDAKAKAEAAEKDKINAEAKSPSAITPSTPEPKRVRAAKRKPATGPNYIGGPSLQWFETLFSPPGKS